MFRRFIIKYIFILIIIPTLLFTFPSKAKAASPTGFIDKIEKGVVYGWAYDPDNGETPIQVHFYTQDPNGGAQVFLANTLADKNRPDLQQAIGSINHGFEFTLPENLKDDVAKYILAYGININNTEGTNSILNNSPMFFVGNNSYKLLVNSKDIKELDGANSFEVVGSSYAYAPSIVKKDNKLHAFFCSVGGGLKWDHIRHASSLDGGATWNLTQANGGMKVRSTAYQFFDYAACDPSVVFFEGYYYLYYGSAYAITIIDGKPRDYDTVVQVARSSNIEGPYLTYTKRNTWEEIPNDPKMIILPLKTTNTSTCFDPNGAPMTQGCTTNYGAGMPSVVSKDGKLYMWYLDDSENPGIAPSIKFMTSTNPIQWDYQNATKVSLSSMLTADTPSATLDMKYDPVSQNFIAFGIHKMHGPESYLRMAVSKDGLIWSEYININNDKDFPEYSHNPGFSGDEKGWLLPSNNFVAFGAPNNLSSTDSWGNWSMFALNVDVAQYIPATSTCNLKNKGDANCDGKINLADFEIFRSEYASASIDPNITLKADFDNNKRVQLMDFEIWRTAFTAL